MSAKRPSPDPGAEVVVPRVATLAVPPAAAVVVAPTPQDRALVVADEPSCGCPTSIVSVTGHLPGCPAAD